LSKGFIYLGFGHYIGYGIKGSATVENS